MEDMQTCLMAALYLCPVFLNWIVLCFFKTGLCPGFGVEQSNSYVAEWQREDVCLGVT
jgi:hypothetical protein